MIYTAAGRTTADQYAAHAAACIGYAQEALAAGDLRAAQAHTDAAEAWNNAAKAA